MIIESRRRRIEPEMVLIWIGVPFAGWVLIGTILYRVLA